MPRAIDKTRSFSNEQFRQSIQRDQVGHYNDAEAVVKSYSVLLMEKGMKFAEACGEDWGGDYLGAKSKFASIDDSRPAGKLPSLVSGFFPSLEQQHSFTSTHFAQSAMLVECMNHITFKDCSVAHKV